MDLIDQKHSVINSGDINIQKINQRKVLNAANFDNQPSIPQRIWYDQLRDSDNGTYSKTSIQNP